MNEAARLSVFRQPYDPEKELLQALDNLHAAGACFASQGVTDNTTEPSKQKVGGDSWIDDEPGTRFCASPEQFLEMLADRVWPFVRNVRESIEKHADQRPILKKPYRGSLDPSGELTAPIRLRPLSYRTIQAGCMQGMEPLCQC